MTDYDSLSQIIRDLGDIPLTVSYNGVFNDGIDNKLSNRAIPVRKNGKISAMNALVRTAGETGTDLYWGANIARVYKKSGNGFNERIHSSFGFGSEPEQFKKYDPSIKQTLPLTRSYTLLNPVYIQDITKKFLAGTADIDKLSINDLGADYHASYRRKKTVTPLAGRAIVDEALEKLNMEKSIVLNNPNIDRIQYACWASNISRGSSNYGGFFASIPFRQLVMNGFVRYTTLDVNNTGESPAYYLLQALELGSVPKFAITSRNADILKYTYHTQFFSTEYAVHRENIREIYRIWNEEFAGIGTVKIINHEVLEDGVFKTSYFGGVYVTVNYNRFEVRTAEGETVPPLGYIIRKDNL